MLDLGSLKWAELEHAYGCASDTPDLIRAIAAEKMPNYHYPGAWCDIYSSLFHQYSTYSATYAALPHIVRATLDGTPRQRMATLLLAGELQIFGNSDKVIPQELLPDFESALNVVKLSSLDTVRDAWPHADIYERFAMLQAFGGLRSPTNGYVAQLGHLAREEWSVEAECPTCKNVMVCQLGEGDILTIQVGHGGQLNREMSIECPLNRESYAMAIQSGQKILRDLSEWIEISTPFVLAALAAEFGDAAFYQKILDLGATVMCAYCEASFVLSDVLTPL